MKWRRLLLVFACLLMEKLVSAEQFVTVIKKGNGFEFECKDGHWEKNGIKTMTLYNKEAYSGAYTCTTDKQNHTLTVRFRTCENCIELDTSALSAIIVGNLLATFLIAFAVYSLTGQPKARTFSGNKASDKVNLISNGDRDTYQQLTPGQHSEYSGLNRKK